MFQRCDRDTCWGCTQGCWDGPCAEQGGPTGPLSPSLVTGGVQRCTAPHTLLFQHPCVHTRLLHTLVCFCNLPWQPPTGGPWCVQTMQGVHKLPQKGWCQESNVWCLSCTHGRTHPLQAMPAGAPAYPSRHSLTPILHFLGLRKSQGVMELVGSCGVQELEQGRIGECRDISGHCTDC